jgi:hypothetical protein
MPETPVHSSSVFRGREHHGARLWLELLGALHSLGYGRLRVECGWENAGPAPVWQAFIAPKACFRCDHGGMIAWSSLTVRQRFEKLEESMFSSRRCRNPAGDHPWSGFLRASSMDSAAVWIGRFPDLAAEGKGKDSEYEQWYRQMLLSTAPAGLVGAFRYWEPVPDTMYVEFGPEGLDRFELPPAGSAES